MRKRIDEEDEGCQDKARQSKSKTSIVFHASTGSPELTYDRVDR